jgi:hypothetical protein
MRDFLADLQKLQAGADRFIDLANAQVSQGESPDIVGAQLLYASARYASFLVARTSELEQVNRSEIVRDLTESFTRYLQHHLTDLAGPVESFAEPPEYGMRPVQEGREKQLASAIDSMVRTVQNIDVALGGYLRGIGKHDLADSLALPLTEVRDNANWDVDYAHRIQHASENQLLGKDIGFAVINYLLTPRMTLESVDGYVRDPLTSDEGRTQMAAFFANHRFHKLSTMVRKDPKRFFDLVFEGESLLVGPQAAGLRKSFYEVRAAGMH